MAISPEVMRLLSQAPSRAPQRAQSGTWEDYIKPAVMAPLHVLGAGYKGIGTLASALDNTVRTGDPLSGFKLAGAGDEGIGSDAASALGFGDSLQGVRDPFEVGADALRGAIGGKGARDVSPEWEQAFRAAAPVTTGVEAAGTLAGQFATQAVLDPVMHGLGALGARAGQAAETAAGAYNVLPEALTKAIPALARVSEGTVPAAIQGLAPETAGTLAKGLGAAFVPGMAISAGENLARAPQAIREQTQEHGLAGLVSAPVVESLGQGTVDAAFAGLGAYHALRGGHGTGESVEEIKQAQGEGEKQATPAIPPKAPYEAPGVAWRRKSQEDLLTVTPEEQARLDELNKIIPPSPDMELALEGKAPEVMVPPVEPVEATAPKGRKAKVVPEPQGPPDLKIESAPYEDVLGRAQADVAAQGHETIPPEAPLGAELPEMAAEALRSPLLPPEEKFSVRPRTPEEINQEMEGLLRGKRTKAVEKRLLDLRAEREQAQAAIPNPIADAATGKPLKMQGFRSDSGTPRTESTYYTSDREGAEQYRAVRQGGEVREDPLDLQNPIVIDDPTGAEGGKKKLVKQLLKAGAITPQEARAATRAIDKGFDDEKAYTVADKILETGVAKLGHDGIIYRAPETSMWGEKIPAQAEVAVLKRQPDLLSAINEVKPLAQGGTGQAPTVSVPRLWDHVQERYAGDRAAFDRDLLALRAKGEIEAQKGDTGLSAEDYAGSTVDPAGGAGRLYAVTRRVPPGEKASVGPAPSESQSFPDIISRVQTEWKGRFKRTETLEDGGVRLHMNDGTKIEAHPSGEIFAAGPDIAGREGTIRAAWRPMGKADSYIRLVERKATFHDWLHDVGHAAMWSHFNRGEQKAFFEQYRQEIFDKLKIDSRRMTEKQRAAAEEIVVERLAETAEKHLEEAQRGNLKAAPGWFKRLWDYIVRIARAFRAPDAGNLARDFASGQVFDRGRGERAARAIGEWVRGEASGKGAGGERFSVATAGARSSTVRELERLRSAMLDAAGEDTAFDAKTYEKRKQVCALTGHCNAAAYVVQSKLGGELLSAKVRGETHVWNRLPDGTEVDLTGSQYGGDGFAPVTSGGRVVPPRVGVNPRFRRFAAKVDAALQAGKEAVVGEERYQIRPDTPNSPDPISSEDRARGKEFLRNTARQVGRGSPGISVHDIPHGALIVERDGTGKVVNAAEVLNGGLTMVAGGPRLWRNSKVPSVGGIMREIVRRGWDPVDRSGNYTDSGWEMAKRRVGKTGEKLPKRYDPTEYEDPYFGEYKESSYEVSSETSPAYDKWTARDRGDGGWLIKDENGRPVNDFEPGEVGTAKEAVEQTVEMYRDPREKFQVRPDRASSSPDSLRSALNAARKEQEDARKAARGLKGDKEKAAAARVREATKRVAAAEEAVRHADTPLDKNRPPVSILGQSPRDPRAGAEGPVAPPRVELRKKLIQELRKEQGKEPFDWTSNVPQARRGLIPKVQKMLDTMSPEQLFAKTAPSPEKIMAQDAFIAGRKADLEVLKQRKAETIEKGEDAGEVNAAAIGTAFDLQIAEMGDILDKYGVKQIEYNTAVARTMSAMNDIMSAGRSLPDTFLRDIFKKHPNISPEKATALANLVRDGKYDQLPEALFAAVEPKFWNKFLEYWKSGLVSAVGTLGAANPGGNILEGAARLAESPFGVISEAVASKFTGEARTRSFGEAGAEAKAISAEAPAAWTAFKADLGKIFRGEYGSLADLDESARKKGLAEVLQYPPAIGAGPKWARKLLPTGNVGSAVRAPLYILSATDAMFRRLGVAAELGKLSHREAVVQLGHGANKEAIAAKAAEIVAGAREAGGEYEHLMIRAHEEAAKRVFQNDAPALRSVKSLRANLRPFGIPIGHFAIPFTDTPFNIFKMMIERSPIGAIGATKAWKLFEHAKAEGKVPTRELEKMRDNAIDLTARAALGSTMFGLFYGAAKAGLMTGAGPTDPKAKKALMETGWQPYSFKIGDTYIPFNRFEPVSSILGFSADAVEIVNKSEKESFVKKAAAAFMTNALSKTYLQGLSDAAGLIVDPERYGPDYVASLAGSLIPNVVAKGAQAIDPVMRETRPPGTGPLGQIAATMQSRVPGASMALPEQKTLTGETRERPGAGSALGAVSRFALPVQVTQRKAGSELQEEFARVGYTPPVPDRKIRVSGQDVVLAPSEQDRLAEEYQKASARAERLMGSPAYKSAPDDADAGQRSKRKLLDRLYDEANDRFKARYASILRARARAKAAAQPRASA